MGITASTLFSPLNRRMGRGAYFTASGLCAIATLESNSTQMLLKDNSHLPSNPQLVAASVSAIDDIRAMWVYTMQTTAIPDPDLHEGHQTGTNASWGKSGAAKVQFRP
jgi:hypothetical protein